jgi:hypothetical protein
MSNIYYDFENFDYTTEEEEETNEEEIFDEYYKKYEKTYNDIMNTIYNSNNNTLLFDMTIDNLISFVESGECPDITKVIQKNDINNNFEINPRLLTHIPKKIKSGWESIRKHKKNRKHKKIVKKVEDKVEEKVEENKLKKFNWTNKKINKNIENLKLIQEGEIMKKKFELNKPVVPLRPTKKEYIRRSKSPPKKINIKSKGFKKSGGFRVNKNRPDRM